MTQIGEGIAILSNFIEDKDKKCDYKPEGQNWTAILDGSGKILAAKLGNKPNALCEAELSRTSWPSQAHHLIPYLTLKSHPVSKWIKAGEYLYADTYYNVDHRNNG